MRPGNLFKSIAIVFCMLTINCGYAQNPNAAYQPPFFADPTRAQKITAVFPIIEKIYREYSEKNHFPGYSFGIMLDGKLVYSGSGGYTDLDKKIPATTRSMFRIASMSKSFTAMAILKLRDEGKLKLDDPVSNYIPEMKGQQLTTDAPAITIRNLLTHSAGFPEDNPLGRQGNWQIQTMTFIALILKGLSLSNDPGLTYEYKQFRICHAGFYHKKSKWRSVQRIHR